MTGSNKCLQDYHVKTEVGKCNHSKVVSQPHDASTPLT